MRKSLLRTALITSAFLISLVAVAVLFAACGVDINRGAQLAGQRCFADSDCGDSLVCRSRICVPVSSHGASVDDGADLGGDETGTNNRNNVVNNRNNVVNNRNNVINNVDPCADVDPICLDERLAQYCQGVSNDGELVFEVRTCPGGCSEIGDGTLECLQRTCIDRDEDGYGVGCERGPDCDDTNPLVNPGMEEDCNTPYDDTCDGRINEGCPPVECCPGGCQEREFCSADCTCEAFDPSVCTAQNQPCDSDGRAENGYRCTSFDSNTQPRCYGICDLNLANPNSSCPDANQACVFGDELGGICLTPCQIDGSCGSSDLGCLPTSASSSDGVCVPANPQNLIGGPCEEDAVFDCEAGAICVPSDAPPHQPRCEQACRPFVFGPIPNGRTDCDSGNCLPFTGDLGLCTESNMANEGQSCVSRRTTCGEDAVGCFPSIQGDQCQRLCRLDRGDEDCRIGSCIQFDVGESEIGVCYEGL